MKHVTLKQAVAVAVVFAGAAVCADTKKAQREHEQGLRYAEARMWKEAEEAFTAAISAAPNPASYIHRAKTRIAGGMHLQAIEDLSEAIKLNPQEAEAWRLRGETNAKVGEPRKSVNDLTRAIDLGLATSPVYAARVDR
jgi:tetratricopeptide (TPR) repeat protein